MRRRRSRAGPAIRPSCRPIGQPLLARRSFRPPRRRRRPRRSFAGGCPPHSDRARARRACPSPTIQRASYHQRGRLQGCCRQADPASGLKGPDFGLQGEFTIQLSRRFQVGLARLVHDPPSGQQMSNFVHARGTFSLSERAPPLPPRMTAAEKKVDSHRRMDLRVRPSNHGRTGGPSYNATSRVARATHRTPHPLEFVGFLQSSCKAVSQSATANGWPCQVRHFASSSTSGKRRRAEARPRGTLAYPPSPTTPATHSSSRNRPAAK